MARPQPPPKAKNKDKDKKKKKRKHRALFIYFYTIMVTISELAGFIFMGAIILMAIRLWHYNPNFTQNTLTTNNIHMFLSSLGSVFLTANGITIFRVLRNTKTSILKHVHAMVLGFSILLTVWGVWSGYKAVEYISPDVVHFKTQHAIMGFISIVLLILQFIIGVFIYMTDVVSLETADSFSGFHGFMGISTLIFTSITGILGISTKANDPLNFQNWQDVDPDFEPEDHPEYIAADYDKFTVEFRVMFAAALFMMLFAWNFFYITVNPYFEWSMVEKY